jgi:hypothetical protein
VGAVLGGHGGVQAEGFVSEGLGVYSVGWVRKWADQGLGG